MSALLEVWFVGVHLGPAAPVNVSLTANLELVSSLPRETIAV